MFRVLYADGRPLLGYYETVAGIKSGAKTSWWGRSIKYPLTIEGCVPIWEKYAR